MRFSEYVKTFQYRAQGLPFKIPLQDVDLPKEHKEIWRNVPAAKVLSRRYPRSAGTPRNNFLGICNIARMLRTLLVRYGHLSQESRTTSL